VLENFQPGDLLARSPTGALIFAGRSNDVFLFRSLLISPFEIEQVLSQRPEVLECLAFGAPSPSHGAVPMAAVVLRSHRDGEATALLVESLRRACQVQLGVRSPKKIVVLHDLPRGATGKPLRRVLAEAHAMKG
jgi:acyl-coenzyme A synthetase/AMP-(fatty) acid ligase